MPQRHHESDEPIDHTAVSRQSGGRLLESASGTLLAVAVGISATLFWTAQPLIGRMILPAFGGESSIWILCLFYFQSIVLLAYVYALWLSTFASLRRAVLAHVSVTAAVLLASPLRSELDAWSPTDLNQPVVQAISILTANSALVLWAVAATTPLAISWGIRSRASNPRRLYAVSNVFSLSSLVAYPVAFERGFSLQAQSFGWMLLCAALVVVVCLFLLNVRSGTAIQNAAPNAFKSVCGFETVAKSLPGWQVPLLAALGAGMLASLSAEMIRELPGVPLFWVIPLALYLVTYIVAFWRSAPNISPILSTALRLTMPLAIVVAALAGWIHWTIHSLVLCCALFVGCLFLHSHLASRVRESDESLGPYVAIALGGVVGTALASLALPTVLPLPIEHFLFLGACVAAHWLVGPRSAGTLFSRDPAERIRRPPQVLAFIAIAVAGTATWANNTSQIDNARNLFGFISVEQGRDQNGAYRVLKHGALMHGMQYQEETIAGEPTAYFSRSSGIGQTIEALREADRGPKTICVIGLGVGTLAAYSQSGDSYHFFELNSEVEIAARRHFTFLEDAAGSIEIYLGDAKVELSRLASTQAALACDLLVVDAFSSGSIPIHLLTLEALEVYRVNLAKHGAIAFHISSRFLHLDSIVAGLAKAADWRVRFFNAEAVDTEDATYSKWALIAPANVDAWEALQLKPPGADAILWTDAKLSIWDALQWQ